MAESARTSLDTARADVVIVGAGIIACAIALRLAQAGTDVMVLERLPVLGREASGTNAGTISLQVNKMSTWPSRAFPVDLAIESVRLWTSIEDQLGTDVEYQLTGGFRVAETREEVEFLAQVVQDERRHGLQLEVLSGNEAREMEPALSDAVEGSSYCAMDGHANAYLATKAFAEAATRAGVRFRLNCEVTDIGVSESPRVTLRTRAGERILCSMVVVAAGVGSQRLAERLGLRVPFSVKINQVCVTEKLPPFMAHVVTHSRRALSLKQLRSGNILIGGGWAGIPAESPQRPKVCFESLTNNIRDACVVMRDVDTVNIIRAWAASDIRLEDHLPLLGPAPMDARVLFAVGDKVGFTLAPIIGEIISELILTGKTSIPTQRFGFDRFETR